MGDLIKIKTDLKASQSLPFIEKIAKMDGLRSYLTKDFNLALNKFRLILIICQQYVNSKGKHEPLQYWVNRDFRIANQIFNELMDSRTDTNSYDIRLYQN